MERSDSEVNDNLSHSQQKYLTKKPIRASVNNNQKQKRVAGPFKNGLSRGLRPFLIFFCLLVSPAIYDQFAPLKTKTEIVKEARFTVDQVRQGRTPTYKKINVLHLDTYDQEYILFDSYYAAQHKVYKGDTLKITKTQILNIPRTFESSRVSFENHDDDYFIFYGAIVVFLMFFLSLLIRGDKATMVIFGLSMGCTVLCVGLFVVR